MSEPTGELAITNLKPQFNLNPFIRFLDSNTTLRNKVGCYVGKDQWVADLACETGYYTLALAECVGPTGRVFAVDLNPEITQVVDKKVRKSGWYNVDVYAASAADLPFILDKSIDFVLANGLI